MKFDVGAPSPAWRVWSYGRQAGEPAARDLACIRAWAASNSLDMLQIFGYL